jgi:hypothetical protein
MLHVYVHAVVRDGISSDIARLSWNFKSIAEAKEFIDNVLLHKSEVDRYEWYVSVSADEKKAGEDITKYLVK